MSYLTFILILLLNSCSNHSALDPTNQNGYLAIKTISTAKFNPVSPHGQVLEYKLTLTRNNEKESVTVYPIKSKTAIVEEIPGGTKLQIKLEVLNTNNICIRRGILNDVTIKANQITEKTVTMQTVPIFANVKEGAHVYQKLFKPKIFAPGNIQFELIDHYQKQNNLITNIKNQNSIFSINKSPSSLLTLSIPELELGNHLLIVRDIDSKEQSEINITVLDRNNTRALISTAGQFLGTLISKDQFYNNNLYHYQKHQALNE